ncbi:MAG: DUF2332 family protein [Polyangiaceae bacterium]
MPLEARQGLKGFDDDLDAQGAYFAERGHATYAALLAAVKARVAADDGLRARLDAAWAARTFSSLYERPLLVCASLRFGALLDAGHPLRAVLGDEADGKAPLPDGALDAALADGAPAFRWLAARYVQTNETTRAVAWRLAVSALWPAGAAHAPLVLVDLGCSAGLNLVGDRLPMVWRDAAGAPLCLAPVGPVEARVGLDRAPVDVNDATETTWLRACLWPGQHDRLVRFDAAVRLARAATAATEMRVEACEATAMPAALARISAAHPAAFVLAYQTLMAEYLPPDARASYEAALEAWLRAHPGRAGWCRLEGAPREMRRSELPAATDLALAGGAGVERFVLALSEWHPSAVHVEADAMLAARAVQSAAVARPLVG